MAYDQNGNYYFDPLDETDQGLLRDRMNEHEINRNLDGLINQGNAAQVMNQIGQQGVQEIATEHNLTPQQVLNMAGQDPDFTRETYKEGVKSFYNKIVSRPRDAHGRYIKTQPGQPQAQPQPQPQPQQQPQDSFYPRPAPPASSDRVEALREAAKENRGDNVSLDKMLSALLPDSDNFLQE